MMDKMENLMKIKIIWNHCGFYPLDRNLLIFLYIYFLNNR